MKDKKPVYVAVDKKDKLFYYDGEKYAPIDETDVEEVESIANQAIQADKDIISQIRMRYIEDDDATYINFPKGIMPLSITINTHLFYIKDNKLVNFLGEEVEGYEIYDISIDDGSFYFAIVGDITEQIINKITYINFNGENVQLINNTYNLFYPQTDVEEVVETVNEAIEDGRIEIPAGMESITLINNSGNLTNEEFEKIKGNNCVVFHPLSLGNTPVAFYKSSEYDSSSFGKVYVYKLMGLPENLTTSQSGERVLPEDKIYFRTSQKQYFYERTSEIITNIVSANPTLSGSEDALTGLQVGSTKYKVGGSELDADVTVEIESNYTKDTFQSRTNYAAPISLAEFISNCENGIYTNPGIIAKINNLIDKRAFRILLIGIDSDVLAYDDTTTAKTTWQFLDMPEHQCELGLPFNIIDLGARGSHDITNAYLDGTNESALTWYPSNKGGYITAVGLLNVLHTIYEGLPIQLKRAIKTVRKAFNIPRQTRSIAANGSAENDSSGTGYIAQKLFHLSATENSITAYGTEGTAYTYLNSDARRIRYYKNTIPSTYWLRTVPSTDSNLWVLVYHNGTRDGVAANDTATNAGVAPGFCI